MHELHDKLSKYHTSYFTYEFSNLYQFYQSNKFINLENTFNLFGKVDIADCFHNIYTHSISWAVNNSKKYSKQNTRPTYFINSFDKLMQNVNYNETNGIAVGWEISRIFSEIIFQRIDLDLEEQLLAKNLVFKRDYEIYRYIDDYHIFTNSKYNYELIKESISDCLYKYKLSLNKSKEQLMERPFITQVSMCNLDLIHLLDELEKKFKEKIYDISSYKIENQSIFLDKIKAKIKLYQSDYISHINFLFSALNYRMISINEEINESLIENHQDQKLCNSLLLLQFQLFRIISSIQLTLISNVQLAHLPTYKFIFCIHFCFKSLKSSPYLDQYVSEYFDKIKKTLLKSDQHTDSQKIAGLNILVALSIFKDKFNISEIELGTAFGINQFDPKLIDSLCIDLTYFEIISLLQYMAQKPEKYKKFIPFISAYINEKYVSLLENSENYKKSELIYLLFDLIGCPIYPNSYKVHLLNLLKSKFSIKCQPILVDNDAVSEQFLESLNSWFVTWDTDDITFENLITKKLVSFAKFQY